MTVTVVVLACFVAQSFARFTFGLLLPAMKKDLGISYGLAGWLGTINLAAYFVSTDRSMVLKELVTMAFRRSHLSFTQSTVVEG